MLQVTATETYSSPSSNIVKTGVNAVETISNSSDRRKEYETLLARIFDSIDNTNYWMLELAKELQQMKESKLYLIEFSCWNDFCRSLSVPGFSGKTGRYADFLIADLNRKQRWLESGLPEVIVDSVLQLPEGVTRQFAGVPEEKQPELVSKLVAEGKPTIKRAKAIVAEDSIPSLEKLIELWGQVGDVTRREESGDEFHVRHPHLVWIDWDFQTRESAWKIWQERGKGYLANVKSFNERKEAEAPHVIDSEEIAEEKEVRAVPVQVEPNSCFGCTHHNLNAMGGFDCTAKNCTMDPGEDYGADCRFWKHNDNEEETPSYQVTEFSLKNKVWARPKKAARPFQQELELLGLVLDTLADERAMLEETGSIGKGHPVVDKIDNIGRTLQDLIDCA